MWCLQGWEFAVWRWERWKVSFLLSHLPLRLLVRSLLFYLHCCLKEESSLKIIFSVQSLIAVMQWCCTRRAAASTLAVHMSGPNKTWTNTHHVPSCLRFWAQTKGRACSPGLISVQTQSHGIRGPTDVNSAGSGCVCVSLQCNPRKVSVQFLFLAVRPYLQSWTCAFSSLAFDSCMWDKDSKSLLWFRLYIVWGRLWMIQKLR